MIADAMRMGLSHADASVLTDVSKHAFEEAMATAKRIVDTAPDRLKLPAFASVLASFGTVMREHFPEHWSAFAAASLDDVANDCVIVLPDRQRRSEPPPFGPGRMA